MDQKRRCPACSSEQYLFRGRQKIAAEKGQAEAMDTKYRCTACEHVWTERERLKKETKQA